MNDLRKYIKDWDIKTIVEHARSNGMAFQVFQMSVEELQKEENIMTREINKRIKGIKKEKFLKFKNAKSLIKYLRS